jgi:Ulp1 family protease
MPVLDMGKCVPQQDNGYDCGLFVLTYMHYFLHALPKALNLDVCQNLQVDRMVKDGGVYGNVVF